MDRRPATRREFVLGALATTTAALTLDGCSDDGSRPSDDELVGDGDGDTSESTSESGTSEESTSEESTSEESTSEESTSEESTSEESTSEESTSEETTTDTTGTEESTTDTTETGDPICPDGASGTVLTNHGHSMIVSAADVQAGVQKVYNIQGAAAHNHTVTLTPGDFSQLALGNVVMKTSSFNAAHDHDVLVSCLL